MTRPPAPDLSPAERATVDRFMAAPDALTCPQGDSCSDQTPCADCPNDECGALYLTESATYRCDLRYPHDGPHEQLPRVVSMGPDPAR